METLDSFMKMQEDYTSLACKLMKQKEVNLPDTHANPLPTPIPEPTKCTPIKNEILYIVLEPRKLDFEAKIPQSFLNSLEILNKKPIEQWQNEYQSGQVTIFGLATIIERALIEILGNKEKGKEVPEYVIMHIV